MKGNYVREIPWKRIILSAAIAVSLPVYAIQDFGHGRVSMHGSILETACAIAMESRSQQIDVGNIPVGEIIRNQRSTPVPFQIKLVNCVLKKIIQTIRTGNILLSHSQV